MTDTLSADVEGLFPVEGEVEQQPEPQAQPVEQAQEAEQVEQRPEVQAQPEQTETALVEQEEKPQHTVPLATFLDKRDEVKELKRQLAEMQAKQVQQPQEPVKIPDPYEDPDGFATYQQNLIQDQAFQLRLDMSGQFAEQAHGKEKVEAAVAWAQEEGAKDPFFGQRLRMQPNPVGWVVEQYNRDQFFKQYGSDPNALTALRQQPQAPTQTVAPQQTFAPVSVTPKQAPPRSLATAPSTSGHQTIPNGAVLDSVKFNLD